jgi:hypothetical protein
MGKPEDYRRYAAECLRLAQGFRGRAEAATLLDMAERWRRLAKEAEGRGAVSEDEEARGRQGPIAKTVAPALLSTLCAAVLYAAIRSP